MAGGAVVRYVSVPKVMVDSRSPNERSPAGGLGPATQWGEAPHSRFDPRPPLRQSLKYYLPAFVLLLLGLVLYGVFKWRQLQAHGGQGYKLPDYSYFRGHCFHRSQPGIVPDEHCERALSKPAKDGQRQPRFHFQPTEGVCYDTLFESRHKVPTEFCNRKPVPADPDHRNR